MQTSPFNYYGLFLLGLKSCKQLMQVQFDRVNFINRSDNKYSLSNTDLASFRERKLEYFTIRLLQTTQFLQDVYEEKCKSEVKKKLFKI